MGDRVGSPGVTVGMAVGRDVGVAVVGKGVGAGEAVGDKGQKAKAVNLLVCGLGMLGR